MKSFIILAATVAAMFLFSDCYGQIKNAKTTTVKVYGNCGMCETTIEKAANKKGLSKADWDQETKMAVLTFDSTRTNVDEILKLIAAAGYDSDAHRATENAYNGLHACCQYDRPAAAAVTTPVPTEQPAVVPAQEPAPAAAPTMVRKKAATQAAHPLADTYAAYFSLKDALVSTDAKNAATQAATLKTALANVNSTTMGAEQLAVWETHKDKLAEAAAAISTGKSVEKQRAQFMLLSDHLYPVMKAVKPEGAVYLEFCPMANDGNGANWMSREKVIRNPYYGKVMLTCGSVQETIE